MSNYNNKKSQVQLFKLVRLYGGTGEEAQKATDMLNLYDWYFVPVHNPDGYDYAMNVVSVD